MRKLSRILALGSILLFTAPTAKAQAIKTNLPLLLAGTPNVGVEFMLSQQSVSYTHLADRPTPPAKRSATRFRHTRTAHCRNPLEKDSFH